MNERIKLLAEQLSPVATIGNWGRVEWSDNIYPQLGDKMYAAIDLEKFAELIVRECAGLCDLYAMPDGTSETAIILSAAIKRKFGVEE